MKRILLVFLGLMAITSSVMGQARDFPGKTVKVIVPFTAGSGSDTSARFFSEKLAGILGQPFVVENKPGASGVISIMALKSAPADGHTILLVSVSLVSVNPVTLKDLPYDPVKDLKPLSGLVRGMTIFVVGADSKLHTLADLVAEAKKAKAPLNAGTYSAGYQLALEWFGQLAGVKFTNVPYKGGTPVFTDLMGGQLDFGIADQGGALSLLKSGKLRALAVSGETRHPDFPDVPTIRESGYHDYINYTWASFYVRSETPDDVTARLADALQKALSTNDAKEFVKKIGGGELMPYAPAAMRKFQMDEYERYRHIAEIAGIKPE